MQETGAGADRSLRPCVFVDRDGCVNTLPSYRGGPGAMELLSGAAPAIRALRHAG